MFLSRLRFFLISACVIGWLSGSGFPIKDGISGVLISLNLFSKWFATVFRISFGFVIRLPSLSSTLGFSNFPRLRALTAENITSLVCALLIASACLFSSSFLSCVTFFLIWCSTSFLSFFNSIFLLSSFVLFILILSSFWRWDKFGISVSSVLFGFLLAMTPAVCCAVFCTASFTHFHVLFGVQLSLSIFSSCVSSLCWY